MCCRPSLWGEGRACVPGMSWPWSHRTDRMPAQDAVPCNGLPLPALPGHCCAHWALSSACPCPPSAPVSPTHLRPAPLPPPAAGAGPIHLPEPSGRRRGHRPRHCVGQLCRRRGCRLRRLSGLVQLLPGCGPGCGRQAHFVGGKFWGRWMVGKAAGTPEGAAAGAGAPHAAPQFAPLAARPPLVPQPPPPRPLPAAASRPPLPLPWPLPRPLR